jgi:hypothetical protein
MTLAASVVNFTKPSLCGPYARGSDSEWALYAEGSYDGCTIAHRRNSCPISSTSVSAFFSLRS